MPYTAEISRANPACFLFLVIQCMTVPSYSADAVNRIVDALSQRCSSGMDIRDYFHIGILGYTTGGFLGMGAPKPKPRWDVHLRYIGDRAVILAEILRPLIAGWCGSDA